VSGEVDDDVMSRHDPANRGGIKEIDVDRRRSRTLQIRPLFGGAAHGCDPLPGRYEQ